MKRNVWTALLLSLVLLLSACGQSAPAGKGAEAGPDVETGPETADTAAPSLPSDVENNGGYFVRLDGKVYFRKYGPDALGQAAVFGEFAEGWNLTGQESEIAAYDLTTETVETVFPESGYGPLYYHDGGWYLQERVNGGDEIARYTLDGSGRSTICDGTLLGVSGDGLIAVQRNRYDEEDVYYSELALFRDGGELCGVRVDSYPVFAGVTADGLFFVDMESNEDGEQAWYLRQLLADAAGTVVTLGGIQPPDPDWMMDTEVEQFLDADGAVGVVVGFYAGTAHALVGETAVTAVPATTESVKEIGPDVTELDEGSDWEESDRMKLYLTDEGEIAVTPHLLGDLEIDYEADGALRFYDGSAFVTLRDSLCPDRQNGSGYGKVVQSMEYVDGSAYVALADTFLSPVNDIGWRTAYALIGMEYLKISASEAADRELAFVDHHCELQGNGWKLADGSFLWQETTFDPEVALNTAEYVYRVPVAADAEYDGSEEFFFDGAEVYTPEAEPEYSGYAVPDVEGRFFRFRLNREGEAVFLTETAPDALVKLVYIDGEEELNSMETVEIPRRESDEDTPPHWVRIAALQDGVTVRLEQAVPSESGLFIPEETLIERTLNRYESILAEVTFPWHPELRVSAWKDGAFGAYVFGEDNYLHDNPLYGNYDDMILSGHADTVYTPFDVPWLYRSPDGDAALLPTQEGDELYISTEEDTYPIGCEPDRIFVREWEPADLMTLNAEIVNTVEAAGGLSGPAGDYFFEAYPTDGDTLLRLVQVNNGDGALSYLLPGTDQWQFVLHSYSGAGGTCAPFRNTSFTAIIAKADAESVWLRAAEVIDEWEDGSPFYRAKPEAPCVCCPAAAPNVTEALTGGEAVTYPMAACNVTFNGDGKLSSIQISRQNL